MSTKGQSLSYDFLTAFTTFLLVVLIIFVLFEYSSNSINDFKKIDEISRISSQISEVWMSEGLPNNWDPENVIELGLLSNQRLNQTKIEYLNEIGYYKVRKFVGSGVYNFLLTISDHENNTIFEFGFKPEKYEFSSKTRRISVLGKKIVYVDTVVWG
ncbi:MAG: hypothetical protein QXY45_01245 [Candidatus Aenigmatarchaeota archaeon]